MGGGNWTASSWSGYTQTRGITNQSTADTIFTSKKISDKLNPKGVVYRESCDSQDNPESTPIIIGVDETGSMGYLAEEIAKKSLNAIFTEIYDKQPITNPHIMFMGLGDAYNDDAPIQVSQFEADIRIAEQLQEIYLEGRGGGNNGESYLLAWYFAARHTKIDCFDKRNKKGFLFTIGDEPTHLTLTKEQIKRFFGDDVEADITAESLLAEVSRTYEVFHLIVGNYKRYSSDVKWRALLDERAMVVDDHTKLPEIIVSTLSVIGGKTVTDVLSQWNGSTSVIVQKAIGGLTTVSGANGLVEF